MEENKNQDSINLLITIIFCIFIPPLAIWWHSRKFDIWFFITFIAWCCFGIPGVIVALIKCVFLNENTNIIQQQKE